jgi:Do/DeqQ family serine protease
MSAQHRDAEAGDERAQLGVGEDPSSGRRFYLNRMCSRLQAMLTRPVCLVLALVAVAVPAAAQTRVVPESREVLHFSYAPIVKKVAPAVVNVFSRRVLRSVTGPALLFNDPFFRRFFGDQFPMGVPRERVENSLGSGVIVDESGLIVTNHHVIKDAQEVRVVLADRREFEAKILLSDERADLAVLKIEPQGEKLPVLAIADSDELEVGDLVLAIGNPFGVGQTVTSGIVSALARSLGAADFRSFIQTDAAINPGNSGGALVDLDGKLVGINTAIFSQSGGSIGIGFAIPTNLVRAVLQAASHGGHVVHPWIGASGQAVTADIAQGLGLPHPQGVLLKEVVPGSPAAEAGLRKGDVVLAVEGHEVDDPDALRYRVATLPPGARARFSLWRSGEHRDAGVIIAAPPEEPPREATALAGRHPLAGASVANLNPAFDDELGFDTTQRGVVVTALSDGDIAEQLGILPGDIVVSLNKQPVESVAQLKQLLGSTRPPWTVTVKRGDKLLRTPPLRG